MMRSTKAVQQKAWCCLERVKQTVWWTEEEMMVRCKLYDQRSRESTTFILEFLSGITNESGGAT